ncbi:extracellular solute-binding protein [Oricola sp.]|uniref:extracellular solute-binding protein n=1 Tax=Oricola sp. TaxID=1979950 RepID=UPI0025E31A63|nr:extracellular solute-binding protein [Oricola sp.]MCI5078050.1 extracellular solute-binding protein [Oricola sp.]
MSAPESSGGKQPGKTAIVAIAGIVIGAAATTLYYEGGAGMTGRIERAADAAKAGLVDAAKLDEAESALASEQERSAGLSEKADALEAENRKLSDALAAAQQPTEQPAAEGEEWHSTASLMSDSKYGDDFQHYDYVNPDAPKGGTLNRIANGSFDSFNPYITRGTPAAGFLNFGGGLLYDTLMEQATDEPSTSHALLAEAFSFPDDYSSAIYRLNPEARWHDGVAVSVDDVIWSFNVLKENSQLYNRYYENVTEAVALNDREVEFRFSETGNRELPHILGDLAVLPKHWWEGTDADGNPRDVTQPMMEPPLGSGPYRIKSFVPGSEIVWERVPDYWGKDLPVKKGRENFDIRKYVYFRDSAAAWEAFKKGGIEDVRPEYRSQYWAEGYTFPAVVEGKVVKKVFPTKSPEPMQGFALNMRRDKFKDRRVRMALSYLFDFATVNRTRLFDLRTRTDSYFVGGELASSGVPEGRELEVLEEFRDRLPPELFTEAFSLPDYSVRGAQRENRRKAFELFSSAGWESRDGKLVNAQTGEQFTIEYLGSSPTDEIIAGQFIEDLRQIGIDASIRIVDQAQEINRLRDFDFDMTTVVLSQSLSPGNEQRDFWSSTAASQPDSRNYSGIQDPVVDALVDKVIFATDREELVATTHALDRVLLWNYYYIPQWYTPEVWLAWWDKFGMPDTQPSYIGVDLDSWWVVPEKEAAVATDGDGR